MTQARELRCYEYVNRPYERVSSVVVADPAGLFQRATTTTAERARSLGAKLKVTVAGLEVGKEVRIEVTSVDASRRAPGELTGPALAVGLRWQASSGESFFPEMTAELLVYPLSGDETQLDLRGAYVPPGSVVGSAVDALVGHRVAEASVHRFLREVAERLSADAA